jgi:hypothetical protein
VLDGDGPARCTVCRATAWLIAQKVLLPAVTTLERHIARLRSRVEERICKSLSQVADQPTRVRLESLLSIPEGGHHSLLDKLRKGPFRRSAPELVRALERIEEVRRLGIDLNNSHRLPPGRLQAMARFASTAKAPIIQRLPEAKRLAMLVAFAMNLEASALDDALDLLDLLISEMLATAARASDRARLRTIKDLDSAAIQLSQIGRMILNEEVPDVELRAAIFDALKREDLQSTLDQIDSLVRPAEDIYWQSIPWRVALQQSPPPLPLPYSSWIRNHPFASTFQRTVTVP